jgi:signal transduction histidine kinase
LNAAQAIDKEGEITIASNVSDYSILISVKDNGCGIPPANISKLFTPFFSTKQVGEGRGLGLSTSYGIIQSLGGTITVESKLNEGTTFVVELPIART